MKKLPVSLLASATLLVTASSLAEPGPPTDRAELVRLALERSPALEAARERAEATSTSAGAEARLPAPEAMVSIWQVPLSRPWAVNDSGMVMVGVQQSFPAPGSLGARRDAREKEADVERAMVAMRARDITREVEHAHADWIESTLRHGVHTRHRELADRVLRLARARHAAGGSLTDLTEADVEVTRAGADVATDGSRVVAAQVRINALLARDPATPLPPPVAPPPEVPAWSAEEIVTHALASRPELRAAAAGETARAHELRASDRETTWPSFSVAALYFAPVGPAPMHGYGVNGSVSLPWLWGPAAARRSADEKRHAAARTEVLGVRNAIRAEAITASATAHAAAARVDALEQRTLPASRRALEALLSGYESGHTDLARVLVARRAVVDVEMDLVGARAALDHAMTDLDAAVGARVPRRPLAAIREEGASDVQ